MPEIIGILGQVAPGATTLTDLYTVPEGITAKVKVIITNRAAETTFRVAAGVGGALIEDKQYVAYNKKIASEDTGSTVEFQVGAGDKIRVYAASANLSFTCTGEERYHA